MSEDAAPEKPRPIEVEAGAEPVKLGSMLFTIVEPHRGHEVAYNRWYERDHFYSGCLIGPYNFAGRRFVATAELKELRDPDPSAITGTPERGSYVALYWVLDGYHVALERMGPPQVNALHAAGRMFEERDHVHTLFYRYCWEFRRDPTVCRSSWRWTTPTGVSCPCSSTGPRTSRPRPSGSGCAPNTCPALLPGSDADLVAAFTPIALESDAPGDVPREPESDRRTLLLWFLSTPPEVAWEPVMVEHRRRLEESGLGTVVAALPFIPTIPGHRYLHRQALGRLTLGRWRQRRARISTCGTTKTPSGDPAQLAKASAIDCSSLMSLNP